MDERPVGFMSINVLEDTGYSHQQMFPGDEDRADIHYGLQTVTIHISPDIQSETADQFLLLKTDLAVGLHAVDIPVAGRGNVELPILRLIRKSQEKFKTGCLPKLSLPTGLGI